MEPTQISPWYSRVAGTLSSAAFGVVSGVGSTVYKIGHTWSSTPKALKLPIETAALLYAPGGWNGPKGLAGIVLLTETPKNLAAFLTNHPVKYFGERWQLFGSSFPSDPKAPLNDLDTKIGSFERAQPTVAGQVTSQKPTDLPSSIEAPLYSLTNIEKITDKNLDILIEKVSYLSILKTMHFFSGVAEVDSTNILSLVDEASRKDKPSLWKIFISHYGSKISWWGRFKAKMLYLFLWNWIPVIPKTVDAYLKNMLTKLRVNLKEDGEKRKKFINGLLEDAENFLEVYNGAAETYANDQARKGNLNHYRKNAVDLMLSREEIANGKTPEERRMDLYQKLGASIVDHSAPKVRFWLFEGLLNRLIQKALRDRLLPEVFLNISEEGKEATQRHNIPFFLALTKTLTSQVSKLQAKLEEDSSDSSSLIGIKNFESIVKKFLWSIDMSECKTAEEVRLKMEKLKQPETGIDADVRNGIQVGIQKGLAVLFDYLSKQENTEELFANLFESVAYPLSGNLPMNDKQWAEMAIEYEGAKILLKQSASSLSKQIVQEAVGDKVRGGSIPEATERTAQKIFSEHKERGIETFEDLFRSTRAIRDKISQLKDFFSEEASILPELGAIASSLKAFENKERVKITMEQDPPPQIALLPNAEQEAILRVLYPLYEGSNQVMDLILCLQASQKKLTLHAKLGRELWQIKEIIEEIASSNSPTASLAQIERIDNHIKNIHALSPEVSRKLWSLKERVLSIREMLERIFAEQISLNALANLQSFPGSPPKSGLLDQLLEYIEGNAMLGFKKWKCIEQIKENIKIAGLPAIEQHKVLQLIDKVNKYNALSEPRPDFNQEIWEPLSLLLNKQKTSLERNQKRIFALLEKCVPRVHQNLGQEETKMHQKCANILEEMDENSRKLENQVLRLHKFIEQAKKENLIHPSASQLGQIGGTLGFLIGLASGKIAPEIGSVIGALATSSVANLSNLAKGKWIKFSIPVLGAGAAAAIATGKLAQAAREQLPDMPLASTLIGAAAASAGLEYVGAKMTKRLIDTGVEIAIPKVTDIFDKTYEHLLTSDIVINGGLKIVMKQLIGLFPPKKY